MKNFRVKDTRSKKLKALLLLCTKNFKALKNTRKNKKNNKYNQSCE